MQTLRNLGNGFLLGALSIALVLGAFAIALAEGGLVSLPAASPTASPVFPTLLPTLPLLLTQAGAASPLPLPASPSPTLVPPPTACPPPPGWQAVLVQPYDTIDSLAALYQVPAAQLLQANCLVSNQIIAGSYIYVPPQATITPIPCGAPFGWVIYYVQPGDTLYRISLLYQVSVAELQRANCLGASTYIYNGQQLRVPNVPVSTATFTAIAPASPTSAITETGTPPTVSPSNTALPSETPSDTPSPAPSDTPPPTLEPSITPTP
ncbi:MAG: hypothetical protein OHK0031_14360 [Anaerolineales bacterium]